MKTLNIGSVSHGTLRNQDLASVLASLVRDYLDDDGLADQLDDIATVDDEDDGAAFEPGEVINEAIDALDSACPAFCTFGFHPGDGSDLGCWPMEPDDIDALRISDLADLDNVNVSECDHDFTLLVNDHGNATLYRLTLSGEPAEVWSIV